MQAQLPVHCEISMQCPHQPQHMDSLRPNIDSPLQSPSLLEKYTPTRNPTWQNFTGRCQLQPLQYQLQQQFKFDDDQPGSECDHSLTVRDDLSSSDAAQERSPSSLMIDVDGEDINVCDDSSGDLQQSSSTCAAPSYPVPSQSAEHIAPAGVSMPSSLTQSSVLPAQQLHNSTWQQARPTCPYNNIYQQPQPLMYYEVMNTGCTRFPPRISMKPSVSQVPYGTAPNYVWISANSAVASRQNQPGLPRVTAYATDLTTAPTSQPTDNQAQSIPDSQGANTGDNVTSPDSIRRQMQAASENDTAEEKPKLVEHQLKAVTVCFDKDGGDRNQEASQQAAASSLDITCDPANEASIPGYVQISHPLRYPLPAAASVPVYSGAQPYWPGTSDTTPQPCHSSSQAVATPPPPTKDEQGMIDFCRQFKQKRFLNGCSQAQIVDDVLEHFGIKLDQRTISEFENNPVRFISRQKVRTALGMWLQNAEMFERKRPPLNSSTIAASRRRPRTIFSGKLLADLEVLYRQNPRPTVAELREYSLRLQIPTRVIFPWFSRRRQRPANNMKEAMITSIPQVT